MLGISYGNGKARDRNKLIDGIQVVRLKLSARPKADSGFWTLVPYILVPTMIYYFYALQCYEACIRNIEPCDW